MKFGISYYGTYPLNEFLQVAEVANKVGADSIWLSEEFIYRDPFILTSSLLYNINNIKLIPGPVSPFFKHPVAIAREILTLAEVDDNRLAIHIGIGDLNGLKQMGIKVSKPLKKFEEAIKTIRRLINGDLVCNIDSTWEINRIKMVLGGKFKIPIYTAAMGPKMLELSRKFSDGTVLSHMTSVDYIRKSIEMVQNIPENIKYPEHEFFQFFVLSYAKNKKDAYNQIRVDAAHWLGVPYPQPVHIQDWDNNGLDVDHMSIYEAINRKELDLACGLVSDKVLEKLAIVGSQSDIESRLQEYLDAGVTYIVINPFGDVKTKIKTVKIVASMFN